MKVSARFRRILAITVLALLYFSGVIARQQYGVRVVVLNQSSQLLRQVTLKLEHGKEYPLGELSPGKRKAAFVEPSGGDSIRLEFSDAKDAKHSQVVAGYVENGYRGDVSVRISPEGRVNSIDNSFGMYNWKSWWAFLG